VSIYGCYGNFNQINIVKIMNLNIINKLLDFMRKKLKQEKMDHLIISNMSESIKTKNY